MPHAYSSAVVLGASMSGLLAARTLSDHFERITVVERDVLPETEETRKGVPQSAHAHGLLASGYRAMDEYFLLAAPSSPMSPRIAWRVFSRPTLKGECSPWGLMRPELSSPIKKGTSEERDRARRRGNWQ